MIGSCLHRGGFLPVILLPFVLWACATSQSSTELRAKKAGAIGTWEYEVSGPAPLDQGTLYIRLSNGRLQGMVHDRSRGRLSAEVRIQSSQMELTVGNYRISGTIDDGHYTGFFRRKQMDASIAYPEDPASRGRQTAYMRAERVRSGTDADGPTALDCRPILRESSACP